MMRFKEYVARRESMEWLPDAVKSVPIWGWAASTIAMSAFAIFKDWLRRRAASRKESRYLSNWWRTLDQLIEETGPDSEQVKGHMGMTQYPPLDAVKDMAELHLKNARTHEPDLRKYAPNGRVPASLGM